MSKIKDIAKQLGKRGGKKSAESRLGGKTKEQKSDLMRKVRLSKKESKEIKKGAQDMVDGLNKSTDKE